MLKCVVRPLPPGTVATRVAMMPSCSIFLAYFQSVVWLLLLFVLFAHHGIKSLDVAHRHGFLRPKAPAHGEQHQHALGCEVVDHLQASLVSRATLSFMA